MPRQRRRLALECLEDRAVPAISVVGPAGPTWTSQGPAPIEGGQTVGITDNPVTGSVHVLAAHPTDADILFAGGSNGGVWRTTNSTAANPTWTPLTDAFPSLSMGAMEFNPTNPNVLLVGIGGYAAGGFDALGSADGDRTGALYTTNALDPTPTFRQLSDNIAGQDASGVAARNSYLLVAGTNGLYRSTDDGATFQLLSGTGSLPLGGVFDLIGDPGNLNRFYVAGTFGVFRCDNASVANPTWTNVTDPQMLIGGATTNIEFAAHNSVGNNVIYVGIVNSGRLAALTFTTDQGANWTAMDTPAILEAALPIATVTPGNPIVITTAANHGLSNGDRVRIAGVTGTAGANGDWVIGGVTPNTFTLVGSNDLTGYLGGGTWQEIVGTNPTDKPGSQGRIHFSIVASPTDPNLVWVGGDRQDTPFPNPIGANNFTGNLWRGDRSIAPGGPLAIPSPQWTPITDNFAGGNSGPHADSREMVFDANGDIVEGDDGGVYRRDNPTSNAGAWTSVNGNLSVGEFWTISLDTVNNILFGGFQDTGTAEQTASGSTTWDQITQGDGFFTAVDNTSIANSSIRYTVGNTFGSMLRRVFDNTNTQVGATVNVLLAAAATPATQLSGLNAQDQAAGASLNPFVLNATDPRLMLIGRLGLYEDANAAGNAGDLITDITPGAMTGQVRALAYGGFRDGVAYPEIAWVGTQNGQLFVRGEGGGAFTQLTTGGAGQIDDIVLDPDDWRHAYVLQNSQIFETTDGGTTFTDITDDLDLLTSQLRSLSLWDPSPGTAGDDVVVLAGGRGGVFRLFNNPYCDDAASGLTWSEYGLDLPNTIVQDLQVYGNTLVAGTYGRGAWTIADVSATINAAVELLVTGDNDDNHMQLRLDPNNPALLLISDGLGNTLTIDRNSVQKIRFEGLGGSDTIRLDSNGTDLGGTIDFIGFLVEADGGGHANDRLLVEDGDDLSADQVTITAISIGAADGDTYFGSCGEVFYVGFDLGEVQVQLGADALGDTVIVEDTHAGVTRVRGGDGDDTFQVAATDGVLHLHGEGGNDTLEGPATGSIYVIDTIDGGSSVSPVSDLTFRSIENLTAGAGRDTFRFRPDGRLSGNVDGGGGALDLLTYTQFDLAVEVVLTAGPVPNVVGTATAIGGTFSNIEQLAGSPQVDTLTDLASTFTLDGPDTGNVDGFLFSFVENLVGGAGVDTLRIALGGSLSGYFDGAGGDDTIDDDSGTANLFEITGPDEGRSDAVAAFVRVENLIGGTSTDVFRFHPGAALSGNIDGVSGAADALDFSPFDPGVTIDLAAGTVSAGLGGTFANLDRAIGSARFDTLVGANDANVWTLTDLDTGDVDGFLFTAIENLTGADGFADTFYIGPSGRSRGTLTGGVGVLDTLDDESNTANEFVVTGVNAGGTDAVNEFVGIENLRGDARADAFVFTPGGSIAGSLDGEGHLDTLDYSLFNLAVTTNLETDTTTAVGGTFSNIETLIGTVLLADRLIGENNENDWAIDGPNQGAVDTFFRFFSIENLQGGTARDVFRFLDDGALTGRIDGQAGLDWLDYSEVPAAVRVNLTARTASRTRGILGIEHVLGSAGGGDVLVGNALNNIFIAHGTRNALYGMGGRDFLVGGAGASLLHGGLGDDLIVSGNTAFDADLDALQDLHAAWSAPVSLAARVGSVLTGSGLANGNALQLNTTVFLSTVPPGPRNALGGAFRGNTAVGSLGSDLFFVRWASIIIDFNRLLDRVVKPV